MAAQVGWRYKGVDDRSEEGGVQKIPREKWSDRSVDESIGGVVRAAREAGKCGGVKVAV